MKRKVDKRDTITILSLNHHDFKFSGVRGPDRKLNASPSDLSLLGPTPLAFELGMGQALL